jgi:tetratricopeptide (TPR) repeat protein
VQNDSTLGAVTCAACGAKVREDRVRCLRCGQLLLAAAPARSAGRLSLRALVMVGAIVAFAGAAAFFVSSPSPATAPVLEGVVGAAAPATVPPSITDAGPIDSPAVAQTLAPEVVAADRRRVGVAAYATGDVAGSLEAFSRAVEADPDDAVARNNLGQLLVRSGRVSESIVHFNRAIALAGDNWAYHFNRARAYGQMQQWAQAIAGYRNAARLFPEDYATQYNLGKALQANGDLEGAITSFKQAVVLAPGQPDFHLALANAQETAERPRDAAGSYRAFLELEPTAADADRIKARIAQLEGTATISTP